MAAGLRQKLGQTAGNGAPQGIRAIAVLRRTRWLGLHLHELIVVAGAICAYGLYDLTHQQPRAPLRLFVERALSLGSYYLMALPLAALLLRMKHIRHWRKGQLVPPLQETWRIFRQFYLTKKALAGDARALLTCVALFVLFIQLKHLVPFIHERLYDDVLIRLEEGWFGGRLLSVRIAAEIDPIYAELLSQGYFLFYPYVAILVYLFVLQRRDRLREEFLTGFALCWLIGVLAVYVFPTLGPCFVDKRFLTELPETGVRGMQLSLLANREKVLATGQGIHLISGFPSLHIVVPVFGTMILWRLSRIASVASGIFLGMTCLTTLYFGWHYLADNVGGVVIGLFIARAVKKYYGQHYMYVRG